MIPLLKSKEIFIFYSRIKKMYSLSTNDTIEKHCLSDDDKIKHFKDFTDTRKSDALKKNMEEISSQEDFSVDTIICYSHEECLSKIYAMSQLNYKKIGHAPKLSSKSWHELPSSLRD